MKLYYTPGACSLAPHIVLEEVGAPFELSRVDLANNQQNSTEYLRINPKARVPALTDGDWILTEAPAILRYVAARHPAAGLWPWDPREEARCAEWLNWLSSTIQVAFTHVRRAARYASDARAVEDVAAIGKKTCRELWQTVDEKVGEGPWAIGERYSVADPLLACLLDLGARAGSQFRHGTGISALDGARAEDRNPLCSATGVRERGAYAAELAERGDNVACFRHGGDVLHRILDGSAVPVGVHGRTAILRHDDEIAFVRRGAGSVFN